MRANAYVLCPCACSVMSLCMLRVQDEFTALNLAYAPTQGIDPRPLRRSMAYDYRRVQGMGTVGHTPVI